MDNKAFFTVIISHLSEKGLPVISAVAHGRGVITVQLSPDFFRTYYLRLHWRIRRERKNKKNNGATGFGYFDHNYPHDGIRDIHQRLKNRLTSQNGVRIKDKPTPLYKELLK